MQTEIKKMRLYLLAMLMFISGALCGDYKYDLAVCAIFQNDAPYLKEWIEFHKLMGTKHFYLYNNLSDDNYQEVLAPYLASGEVEIINWPMATADVKHWDIVQAQAYTHCLIKARKEAKWLAVIDTDEFVFPVQADNLVDFLKEYENFGAVIVSWQCYGTSYVEKVPDDALMIEMLLFKENPKDQSLVKSIVRPAKCLNFMGPHFGVFKNGIADVNSNKSRVSGLPPTVIDKIRINHYWTRDEDYFYNVKIPRRIKWGQDVETSLQWNENYNQEYDDAIMRFVPALRKQMGLPE